jgi:hypothetical protein
MPIINKGLFFSLISFLIAIHVLYFDETTMPSFDAHAIGMLIALAIATLALVIKSGVVSVVRVVEVVSVVPIAPSRAGRK